MNLQIVFVVLTIIYFSKGEEIEQRVYNGAKVKIGEHKHLVKIIGDNLCSGSIIGSSWVLTAAHCVYGVKIDKVFHHSDLAKHIAFVYGSYTHPQYNTKAGSMSLKAEQVNVDIGLVKTSYIKFNQYIQSISMPTQSPKANEKVTLAGFGETNYGAMTKVPLQGDVELFKCPKLFAGTSAICTKGMVGTGRGDSGGPMTTANGLVGVNSVSYCVAVSGTRPCYSVATNVADKLTWINHVMK